MCVRDCPMTLTNACGVGKSWSHTVSTTHCKTTVTLYPVWPDPDSCTSQLFTLGGISTATLRIIDPCTTAVASTDIFPTYDPTTPIEIYHGSGSIYPSTILIQEYLDEGVQTNPVSYVFNDICSSQYEVTLTETTYNPSVGPTAVSLTGHSWISYDASTRQISLGTPPTTEGRRTYKLKVVRTANPGSSLYMTDEAEITIELYCPYPVIAEDGQTFTVKTGASKVIPAWVFDTSSSTSSCGTQTMTGTGTFSTAPAPINPFITQATSNQLTVTPTTVAQITSTPYTVTALLDNDSSSGTKLYTFKFVVTPECDVGREWEPITWPDKVQQLNEEVFTVPDELQEDQYGDWSTVCSKAIITIVDKPDFVTYDHVTRQIKISPTLDDQLTNPIRAGQNPLTGISQYYGDVLGLNSATDYRTITVKREGSFHKKTVTDMIFDVFCPFIFEISQNFTTMVEGEEKDQVIYTEDQLFTTQQYYPNEVLWKNDWTEKMNRADGLDQCKKWNSAASLVKIETEWENEVMKGLAATGNFYIGLNGQCTWIDTDVCPALITLWTAPNHAADWWSSQANQATTTSQCVVQTPTGWSANDCLDSNKYLCEKTPQCVTPTFTATGCDWITAQGNKIILKPDKVRHIQNSPCELWVTRTVGTDSLPHQPLSYSATPDCAAKTWNPIDAGQKAQLELNPMLLNTVATLQVPLDLQLDGEGQSWSEVCCFAEVVVDGSSNIATFDQHSGNMTIAPTLDVHIGLHKFFVTQRCLENGVDVQQKVTEIEIRVVSQGPEYYIYERPYFHGGLHKMNKTEDDKWVWSLPPIIDPKEENHTEIVRVSYGPQIARSFLHYNNVTQTFWIDANSTLEFPVTITVTLDITAYDVAAIPHLPEGKQIFKRNATYSFQLEVHPRNHTPHLPEEEYWQRPKTLSLKLHSIDKLGLVKCNFTEPVLVVNETLDRWPDGSILQLRYTDDSFNVIGIYQDTKQRQGRRLQLTRDDPKAFQLNWHTVNMTDTELWLQLVFSNVHEISNNFYNLKQLRIDVKNATYFVANQTKVCMKEDVWVQGLVPVIFANSRQASLTKTIGVAMVGAISVAGIWVILLQFSMKKALKYFWSLYNLMQFVLCFLVMSVDLPANVTVILTMVMDALQGKALTAAVDKNVIKSNFVEGVKASRFAQVCHIISAILLLVIIGIIIRKTMEKWACSKKIWEKMTTMLFFSAVIRKTIQTYTMDLAGSGAGRHLSLYPEKIEVNPVSLFILLAVAIISVLATKFVEPSLMDDKDFAKLFNSFYYGVYYDPSQVASWLYLFFVRRICFVMSMQIDIMSVRIALLLVIQGVQTLFILQRRPYEDDNLNNMELINEGIFTLILMVVPLYSNLTIRAKDKYDLGWILVALLCIALLAALGNLTKITIAKCKKSWAAKKASDAKKAEQLELERIYALPMSEKPPIQFIIPKRFRNGKVPIEPSTTILSDIAEEEDEDEIPQPVLLQGRGNKDSEEKSEESEYEDVLSQDSKESESENDAGIVSQKSDQLYDYKYTSEAERHWFEEKFPEILALQTGVPVKEVRANIYRNSRIQPEEPKEDPDIEWKFKKWQESMLERY